MAPRVKIDDAAYNNMLEGVIVMSSTEVPGRLEDISFIDDDFWLQDTAVIENVELRKGEWNVFLVFAHYLKPLKLIKRKIVNFACHKKALTAAHYMRRQAAKDQRGTLYVKQELINIIFN